METVILSSIAARVAINVIDRYVPNRIFERSPPPPSARPVRQAPKPTEPTHTPTTIPTPKPSSDTAGHVSSETTPSPSSPSSSTTNEQQASSNSDEAVVDENDVASLERRIKSLRTQAQQLTSADTFVQYARVTREANKLEKRLKELKGPDDNTIEGLVDVDKIAKAMSKAFGGGSPVTSIRQSLMSTKTVLKLIVRVLSFAILWWQFSYVRGSNGDDGMRGQVIHVNCRVVAPFQWMLKKHSPICHEDDYICAADMTKTCSVSVYVCLWLCNAALAFVVDVVTKLIYPQ